jgi:hypothetical protein
MTINYIIKIVKSHTLLYNIGKFIKKLFLLVISPIGIILDLYTVPHNCPPIPIYKRIANTFIYRISQYGMYLKDNEKSLVYYNNRYTDSRCFIIGNGPSLNHLDLSKIKDEFTFGVNAIYTNYEKMEFLPTFYVVEDVFVAEDRAEEINELKGTKKFFGNYLRYCLSDKDDITWINVIFRYDKYKNFPHFSKNALRRVWTGGTVSYLCMQLAFYMGFKEVYLIGFDHSYHIPKEAQMDGNDIISTTDDPNHFNSEYFGPGKRWHDPMVSRMEIAYYKAKSTFEEDGRKIYNATCGGQLEVFNRIDYNQLF